MSQGTRSPNCRVLQQAHAAEVAAVSAFQASVNVIINAPNAFNHAGTYQALYDFANNVIRHATTTPGRTLLAAVALKAMAHNTYGHPTQTRAGIAQIFDFMQR